MNPEDLLKLMQHIIVWLPHGSSIRQEVQQIIDNIKTQKFGRP
jgi:hypothetical protein